MARSESLLYLYTSLSYLLHHIFQPLFLTMSLSSEVDLNLAISLGFIRSANDTYKSIGCINKGILNIG